MPSMRDERYRVDEDTGGPSKRNRPGLLYPLGGSNPIGDTFMIERFTIRGA
jgi:hypothetical protein